MVSTINEFTHGTEPMILRVTHIQFAYEYVKVNPVIPRITQSIVGYPTELLNSCEYPDPYAAHPVCNMSEADMYNYHLVPANGGEGYICMWCKGKNEFDARYNEERYMESFEEV